MFKTSQLFSWANRPPRNFNVDVALPERINAVQAMKLNEMLLTKITVFELKNVYPTKITRYTVYNYTHKCVVIYSLEARAPHVRT